MIQRIKILKNIYFHSSQEEYSPEDPANPCVNYPTEEYESYADCDDQFVRNFLPPGLKPFWNVDNISEATNTFYLEYDLYLKAYNDLSTYVFIMLIYWLGPKPWLEFTTTTSSAFMRKRKILLFENNLSF